jgi:hypothetical protein
MPIGSMGAGTTSNMRTGPIAEQPGRRKAENPVPQPISTTV